MGRVGVLDCDHVFALAAGIAEFRDGGGGVRQKPGLVGGIGPCSRDHSRAVPGANLVFVVFDDGIQGRRIDKAFFDQQGFERLDPEREIAGNRAVPVVMSMAVGIVGTHEDILESCRSLLACSRVTPSKRKPKPPVSWREVGPCQNFAGLMNTCRSISHVVFATL